MKHIHAIAAFSSAVYAYPRTHFYFPAYAEEVS